MRACMRMRRDLLSGMSTLRLLYRELISSYVGGTRIERGKKAEPNLYFVSVIDRQRKLAQMPFVSSLRRSVFSEGWG